MKRTLALIVFAGVAAANCGIAQTSPSLQPAKPSYVAEVLTVVPSDLHRLFEKSAIVARVRITESSPVVIDRGNLGPTIRTRHAAAVIALYKGDGQPRTIEFYQTAGSVETERYSIRVAEQTALVAGREYVVFLAPYRFFKSYSLVGEDNGAFEIAGSRIQAVGAAEVSRVHDNMPVDRFLAELRK
jgi:hypothetical protein